MKKRGFGEGRWNGVGGKVDPGESPLQAAIRECQEEITVTPTDLKPAGQLHFFDYPDTEFYCHIFTATTWQGTPTETEEMRPQWFTIASIPYDIMWPDDIFWLPTLLEGKLFKGKFVIGQYNTVEEHEFNIVPAL